MTAPWPRARKRLEFRRGGADHPGMGRVPPAVGERHRSRGATLVEYALIISVFVFGAMGAISRLDNASDDYYHDASDDIGDLPQSDVDLTDEGTVPDFTGPPTTSTTSTTTTVAPTTTSTTTTTTTTTTTSTTTTTTPTTTTTVAAQSTIAELTDISAYYNSTYYDARARVRISNTQTGGAVANATVYFYLRDDNGNVNYKTCQTSSTGRCSVTWRVYRSASPVLAYVYHVAGSPAWDESVAYTFLYR